MATLSIEWTVVFKGVRHLDHAGTVQAAIDGAMPYRRTRRASRYPPEGEKISTRSPAASLLPGIVPLTTG